MTIRISVDGVRGLMDEHTMMVTISGSEFRGVCDYVRAKRNGGGAQEWRPRASTLQRTDYTQIARAVEGIGQPAPEYQEPLALERRVPL